MKAVAALWWEHPALCGRQGHCPPADGSSSLIWICCMLVLGWFLNSKSRGKPRLSGGWGGSKPEIALLAGVSGQHGWKGFLLPCVGFGFKGDCFSDKCLLVWRLGKEKLATEAEEGPCFILPAEAVVRICCNGCHGVRGWWCGGSSVTWRVGHGMVDVAWHGGDSTTWWVGHGGGKLPRWLLGPVYVGRASAGGRG